MMADPKHATLVQRPDTSSFPSNTLRTRDVVTVTTNNFGAFALSIAPGPAENIRPGVLTTGTQDLVNFDDETPSSFYTAINADNSYIRVLSYVVEWICTQAPTAASGRVFLGTYVETGSSNLQTGNISQYFDDEGATGPESEPLAQVVRPFADPVFLSALSSGMNYMPISAFMVTGAAASSTIGQLVITRIIEVVPRSSALSRSTATVSHCDAMACCMASNIAGPKVTSASGPSAYATLSANALAIARAAAKAFSGPGPAALAELLRIMT